MVFQRGSARPRHPGAESLLDVDAGKVILGQVEEERDPRVLGGVTPERVPLVGVRDDGVLRLDLDDHGAIVPPGPDVRNELPDVSRLRPPRDMGLHHPPVEGEPPSQLVHTPVVGDLVLPTGD